MRITVPVIILTTILLPSMVLAQGSKGIKVQLAYTNAQGTTVGSYSGSYALLVGVSKYTQGWPSLEAVPGEMDEVETALKQNGFEVRKVMNPDSEQLAKAFDKFIKDYGYDKDNRLLFFFSGHGWSRKGGEHGYLVPTDAPDPTTNEKEFLRRALNMTQILAWCKVMDAKHAIFLFDSCFSGTIFQTKALPEKPPHITALTAKGVRQFITAGEAGEQVPAKSVFVKCFIRGLEGEADLSRDGYVTGTELGMYLHDKVIYYKTGQTPQYGKMRDVDWDQGDLVFEVGSATTIPSPTKVTSGERQESATVPKLKDDVVKARQEALQRANGVHTKTRFNGLGEIAAARQEQDGLRGALAYIMDVNRRAVRGGRDRRVARAAEVVEEARKALETASNSRDITKVRKAADEAAMVFEEMHNELFSKIPEYQQLTALEEELQTKLVAMDKEVLDATSDRAIRKIIPELQKVRQELSEITAKKREIRIATGKEKWNAVYAARSEAAIALKAAIASSEDTAAAAAALVAAEAVLAEAVDTAVAESRAGAACLEMLKELALEGEK